MNCLQSFIQFCPFPQKSVLLESKSVFTNYNIKEWAVDMTEKQREKGIYKVTITGSIVNFLLILFKFFAGFLGHSAAMIADAVHSLSDFFTDIVVIAFVRISNKPEDTGHTYGHGKYETLATLIIGVVLLLVGLGIFWNGMSTVISVYKGAVLSSPGKIALLGALFSIIAKEILYRYTMVWGKKLNSDVVIANAWHHRSDAFSSLATLVGIAGAILLGDKWTVLDPLAGILVSLFIVRSAIKLIRPALDELLEKSLPEPFEREIKQIAYSVEGVSGLHNLRTRKIGNYCAIEFHICMNGKIPLASAHALVSQIEDKLKERFGSKTHIIIHIEPFKKEI